MTVVECPLFRYVRISMISGLWSNKTKQNLIVYTVLVTVPLRSMLLSGPVAEMSRISDTLICFHILQSRISYFNVNKM